jgi:hypothetical protein
VQVGLPCEGFLETMNMEGGSGTGTAQGKVQRVHFATVRVLDSLGGVAGPDEDHLAELSTETAAFTGDLPVEWDADYSTQSRLLVKKDRPMPLKLVAIMPQGVASEGR